MLSDAFLLIPAMALSGPSRFFSEFSKLRQETIFRENMPDWTFPENQKEQSSRKESLFSCRLYIEVWIENGDPEQHYEKRIKTNAQYKRTLW